MGLDDDDDLADVTDLRRGFVSLDDLDVELPEFLCGCLTIFFMRSGSSRTNMS